MSLRLAGPFAAARCAGGPPRVPVLFLACLALGVRGDCLRKVCTVRYPKGGLQREGAAPAGRGRGLISPIVSHPRRTRL